MVHNINNHAAATVPRTTHTSCADASVLRTKLVQSCLHRHLVLDRRLVYVAEFLENFRGHRLQLLGTQALLLDGALARCARVSPSVDLASALHESLPKLRQRRPRHTLVVSCG